MDTSVVEYQTQLLTVEQALQSCKNDEERASLQCLKSDLIELLELTKQTAAAQDETNELDYEMQRFMSEIGRMESRNSEETDGELRKEETSDYNVESKLKELKVKLEEMVGYKCSVPHQHTWGAVAYHNAIVCGVEDNVDVGVDGSLNARLRVLFTNPTHREMLPCSYYLDGDCRFDAAQCHYSHGELVSAEELREYTEPDFTRLARNCVVLVKLKDRLWHRGRVLCANFVEKSCRVRLESNENKVREQDFVFEDLLPIFHDEDLSSGSSSDSNDESESEELDDEETARRAYLVEQSLFSFKPAQALGEWEKHTRGIGSKLMAKMGYIHGTGLGSDGRGIVTPVTAQILPQGCSLDHCMELREAANGDKNLFSVEKKVRREQKKQAAINAKIYERDSQRVDVFSFLNENIFGKQSKDETICTKNEKPALHRQTTKSLNVESVRIADGIRRKEREIEKLQESMRRNSSGTDIHNRLQSQLNVKTQELNALQKEERNLSKEQATRRTTDKLKVF